MPVIVSALPVSLLGRQDYITQIDSTPVNILGNPLISGRHMIALVDGNIGSFIASLEILTVTTLPAQTGFVSSNVNMPSTESTVWDIVYGNIVFQLTYSSNLFYISSSAVFNNLLIREFFICQSYPGIDNLYGIDKITTSNPSSTAKISFLKGVQLTSTTSNAINFGQATVTQVTNLTTPVTINSGSGVITTVSATTPALSTQSFTVNNSVVSATSVIVVSIVGYTGSTIPPIVTVSDVASGSFVIKVTNIDSLLPLDGVIKISFITA